MALCLVLFVSPTLWSFLEVFFEFQFVREAESIIESHPRLAWILSPTLDVLGYHAKMKMVRVKGGKPLAAQEILGSICGPFSTI